MAELTYKTIFNIYLHTHLQQIRRRLNTHLSWVKSTEITALNFSFQNLTLKFIKKKKGISEKLV